MLTIRPAIKWFHAFAALLLLAAGPVVEPSRAEGRALSQVADDLGKAVALKREQPCGPVTERQRFDNDGDPDAALAHAHDHPAPVRALVLHFAKTDSSPPRFPRFCGASPRAPPFA